MVLLFFHPCKPPEFFVTIEALYLDEIKKCIYIASAKAATDAALLESKSIIGQTSVPFGGSKLNTDAGIAGFTLML